MNCMPFKNCCILLLSAMLLMAFELPEKEMPSKSLIRWVVQKSSSLHIAGKTNVAPFGCAIRGYYQTDTITYSENATAGKLIPLTGMLHIAIKDFSCGNKALTHDLRKTLKATAHPFLTIRLIALERVPDLTCKDEKIKGWIDVAMAGVTKRFEILYSLEKQGTLLHLDGRRTVHFSEFNLVPPQRLGGMVKVKNAFVVDFSLVLQQLS